VRAKLYDTEVVLKENTKESKSIEDRGESKTGSEFEGKKLIKAM